jgi:hypothetical protein
LRSKGENPSEKLGHSGLELLNELLDSVDGGSRAASLGNKHLAVLVDNKHTSLGALGGLLQTNGSNKSLARVTEQGVWKLLLLLEGGVGLGGVIAQAVDGEAVGSQRLVRVAEEANLSGACKIESRFG